MAIARRLSISPHTVNRHLEKIYRKLDTRDRLATVLPARRLGLVRPGV
ncbi:LuxR C-terminal-related transcriptional regulator [Streptomyces tailanensis]